MTVRYIDEVTNWNNTLSSNPDCGNILQGAEFIEQKVAAGWTARFIDANGLVIAALEKHVLFFGKVWYIPKGPGVATKAQLATLLPSLTAFAKKSGVFSIKIEPELDHTIDLSDLGLIKTKPIQANASTVLIDLAPSLDDILASLNQKGRHALRRAERDGVTVEKVELSDENLETMYKLLVETGTGAGFPVRPADYYKTFYQRYGDNGGLFLASFEGRVVAGAFAMVQGTKSIYKDGASVRDRPAYGASHLLQWEVIKWAKSMGSLEHDLAGVPPIAQLKNPEHPYYGIGRFKTSFNKSVTEYVGAYDIPVRPLRAKLWHNFFEKVVRRLYFKKHHQSYY